MGLHNALRLRQDLRLAGGALAVGWAGVVVERGPRLLGETRRPDAAGRHHHRPDAHRRVVRGRLAPGERTDPRKKHFSCLLLLTLLLSSGGPYHRSSRSGDVNVACRIRIAMLLL